MLQWAELGYGADTDEPLMGQGRGAAAGCFQHIRQWEKPELHSGSAGGFTQHEGGGRTRLLLSTGCGFWLRDAQPQCCDVPGMEGWELLTCRVGAELQLCAPLGAAGRAAGAALTGCLQGPTCHPWAHLHQPNPTACPEHPHPYCMAPMCGHRHRADGEIWGPGDPSVPWLVINLHECWKNPIWARGAWPPACYAVFL